MMVEMLSELIVLEALLKCVWVEGMLCDESSVVLLVLRLLVVSCES